MQAKHAAREFELKLQIPVQAAGKVMRLPWLWELATDELQASSLQAIYYDTPDFALRARGLSLRVRRSGTRRVRTIKAAVNGAVSPIERDEWEEEIAEDQDDLKLKGTPLAAFRRKKRQGLLAPCFEIHVDRSAFPIQSANSSIEVAIDRAHIVGEEAASFCEIELELKRGASGEMARVARRIATEVPAALSLKTKAERGYALRARSAPAPFLGEGVALTASTRVGEAFQAIGWACLRHFALNKDAAEAGALQALHQMRAGLARLLAAIAIFDRLLDGPETDAVKEEVNWLAGELTPACELDHLLEGTLLPVECDPAEAASVNALCDEVALRRHHALEHVKQSLASDRYRQLELRIALWLIAAEWSDKAAFTSAEPSRRVARFAREALDRAAARTAKLLARGGPAKRVHRALLNLYYAADYFSGLFPTERPNREKLQRRIEKLLRDAARLEALGLLERLRDEFMTTWSAPGTVDANSAFKGFALGLALGQQSPDKAVRLRALKKGKQALAAIQPFWR